MFNTKKRTAGGLPVNRNTLQVAGCVILYGVCDLFAVYSKKNIISKMSPLLVETQTVTEKDTETVGRQMVV